MKIKNKLIQNIIIFITLPFVVVFSIARLLLPLLKTKKTNDNKSIKIERYIDFHGVNIDENKLPIEFQEILPYAKEYGIPDDVQRNIFISSVSIEELIKMDHIVWNKMKDIENYCDENKYKKDFQDIVLLLGYFSEAAAEIHWDKRILNKNNG